MRRPPSNHIGKCFNRDICADAPPNSLVFQIACKEPSDPKALGSLDLGFT